MKLLFDIGNTSVHWAVEDEGHYTRSGWLDYDTGDLAERLDTVLTGDKATTPEAVLLASVAGQDVIKQFNDWTVRHWSIEPWVATVTRTFGSLKNGYVDLNEMGVDRWLAMVAAWDKHKTAICVVDCGTALTIDLIDDTGAHLGGYILPGQRLMQQSLINNTNGINVDIEPGFSAAPADNTQSAIANGTGLALLATINQAIRTFGDEINRSPACVITGGEADTIRPLIDHPVIHEPLLVLDGLSLLHRAA